MTRSTHCTTTVYPLGGSNNRGKANRSDFLFIQKQVLDNKLNKITEK